MFGYFWITWVVLLTVGAGVLLFRGDVTDTVEREIGQLYGVER